MSEATRSYETLARIIDILADAAVSKLVVVHHNGDPDALGSALALQAVFPDVKIGAPLGLSKPAKSLLEAVDGTVLERPHYKAFDYIIIVDTSSPVQLGEDAAKIKEPIILDHHAYHDEWQDALYLYVDPNKAACCELVYELIETAADEEMTDFSFSGAGADIHRLETVGLALMTGIWTDTAGFRYATPRTFQIAANLLSVTGTSMTDVLGILEQTPEFSDGRAEAQLKAAQRLRYERIDDLLVATSHISSYEAGAARAMTLLGADVAFCVADNNKEIRASARARKEAVDRHHLHLGTLLNRVGKTMGFMGGGHDGAAGMNLPKRDAKKQGKAVPGPEEVLEALLKGLKEELAKGGKEKGDEEE